MITQALIGLFIALIINYCRNVGAEFKFMSKRRSAVIGRRGHGGHAQEQMRKKRRPGGVVRPIISARKHGKNMDILHKNNDDKAAAFGRFVWLVMIIMVVAAISKCAI